MTALVRQLGRWILTFSWCPVSVLSSFRGETKKNPRGVGGWRWLQSFHCLLASLPSTQSEEMGYENHPTTVYSIRTRARSWTCLPVDVVSPYTGDRTSLSLNTHLDRAMFLQNRIKTQILCVKRLKKPSHQAAREDTTGGAADNVQRQSSTNSLRLSHGCLGGLRSRGHKLG